MLLKIVLILALLKFGSTHAKESINEVEDDADDFWAPTSTFSPPPPDPFGGILSDPVSVDDKLDELDQESQQLIVDFIRNGRKLYGDLRRRLILYVMKFSPIQDKIELSNDERRIQKIQKIKQRFRSGLKIRYSSLKSQIDRLVAHLLAPIFAPFMLLQPDEVRPLLISDPSRSHQFLPFSSTNTNFRSAPITVDAQQVSNQQSSFSGLELFPSSLPQDKWPQFDARWFSQQPVSSQFSAPTFNPYYQPFQYYRSF